VTGGVGCGWAVAIGEERDEVALGARRFPPVIVISNRVETNLTGIIRFDAFDSIWPPCFCSSFGFVDRLYDPKEESIKHLLFSSG
jgi:hypothetical protein